MSSQLQLQHVQGVVPWKRPADWLPLPVPRQDQLRSLIALVAVFPRPTSLGFVVYGVPYTVDWGDGVVERFQSGQPASHVYTYGRLPASTQCSRGYRQAIVKVSWEAAGVLGGRTANALEVTDYTARSDLTTNTTPLLDVQLAGRTLSNLVLSPRNKPSRLCEQVWMRPLKAGIRRWNNYSQGLFENMNSLQSVPEFSVGDLVNLSRTFRNCKSLKLVPEFDASAVESMEDMFAGCAALQGVTLSAELCRNYKRAFQGCTSLREVIVRDSAEMVTWQDAFSGCTSLQWVDIDHFDRAQDLSGMFRGCVALRAMAEINAPQCKTTEAMFHGCVALTEMGAMAMPQNQNIIAMFYQCWSMRELPLLGFGDLSYVSSAFAEMYALETPPRGFDTPECWDFTAMFANCVNLTRAPELNTSQGLSFNGVLQNCTALEEVPGWDMSGVSRRSGLDLAFDNLPSCTRVRAFGMKASFSLKRLPLQAEQLNEVFHNLGVIEGNPQTVVVGGVYGALQDGLRSELALSKGWQIAA